jgi:hypothetical protein
MGSNTQAVKSNPCNIKELTSPGGQPTVTEGMIVGAFLGVFEP